MSRKYFSNLRDDVNTRQISVKINAANHAELRDRCLNVSALINRLVADYLDSNGVLCSVPVEGDINEADIEADIEGDIEANIEGDIESGNDGRP